MARAGPRIVSLLHCDVVSAVAVGRRDDRGRETVNRQEHAIANQLIAAGVITSTAT